MALRYPDNLSKFFGMDPLYQYDEYVLSLISCIRVLLMLKLIIYFWLGPDEIRTITQNKNK